MSAMTPFTKFKYLMLALLSLLTVFRSFAYYNESVHYKLKRGSVHIYCNCVGPNNCAAGPGPIWCGDSQEDCNPAACGLE
jgi:hypothetical protein